MPQLLSGHCEAKGNLRWDVYDEKGKDRQVQRQVVHGVELLLLRETAARASMVERVLLSGSNATAASPTSNQVKQHQFEMQKFNVTVPEGQKCVALDQCEDYGVKQLNRDLAEYNEHDYT